MLIPSSRTAKKQIKLRAADKLSVSALEPDILHGIAHKNAKPRYRGWV